MRSRWPRSLVAMLLASSAGALGAAALAAGGAAVADGATCGTIGSHPCPPSGTISAQTTETDGTIVITWTPHDGTPVVTPDTPTLTWVLQPNQPVGAPQPTIAPISLGQGSCDTPPGSTNFTCTYSWPPEITVAGYVLNGTYTVKASAVDCLIAAVGCSDPVSVPQSIAVANAPAVPPAVKSELAQNSSAAKISWNRNPEPDIVGYQVLRGDGSLACNVPAGFPVPPAYSCVDTPTKDGKYAYTVVAHRWGATYSTKLADEPGTSSGPTAPLTLVGTKANTTTTLAGGAGSLGPAGFTAKPSPNKLGNIGAAGTGRFNGTPRPAPGGAAPAVGDTPPGGDTGFQPTLPYGQQRTPPSTSDPAVITAPGIHHTGKASVGNIAVVGAGLLLAVVALHGLWLRSEVRRPGTLEALDPEA